jgi:hypothetical protein
MRPRGFTALPEHLESCGSLWRDDHGEAIPNFYMGIWSWDNLIVVALHRDQHTTGWQPQFIDLFPIKRGTLLHSELHNKRRMLLQRIPSTPEVALQHRFVDGLVAKEVRHGIGCKTGNEEGSICS